MKMCNKQVSSVVHVTFLTNRSTEDLPWAHHPNDSCDNVSSADQGRLLFDYIGHWALIVKNYDSQYTVHIFVDCLVFICEPQGLHTLHNMHFNLAKYAIELCIMLSILL